MPVKILIYNNIHWVCLNIRYIVGLVIIIILDYLGWGTDVSEPV